MTVPFQRDFVRGDCFLPRTSSGDSIKKLEIRVS